MNTEYMRRMSGPELDEYAALIGAGAPRSTSVEGKIEEIERARAHRVTVRAIGLELTVTKKSLSDKRVTDLLAKPDRTDRETEEMMRTMLGDEQFGLIVEAATDEDGTVDNAAVALAFAKVMTSDELKNS